MTVRELKTILGALDEDSEVYVLGCELEGDSMVPTELTSIFYDGYSLELRGPILIGQY